MKNLILFSLAFFATLFSTFTLAYDKEISNVKVGTIRVYGNSAGAAMFTQKDGSAFPGCTNSPTQMWNGLGLQADGLKSILSALLMAKAADKAVTVYYSTADGYCRYEILDIE